MVTFLLRFLPSGVPKRDKAKYSRYPDVCMGMSIFLSCTSFPAYIRFTGATRNNIVRLGAMVAPTTPRTDHDLCKRTI